MKLPSSAEGIIWALQLYTLSLMPETMLLSDAVLSRDPSDPLSCTLSDIEKESGPVHIKSTIAGILNSLRSTEHVRVGEESEGMGLAMLLL
jgi:hypothetical protein